MPKLLCDFENIVGEYIQGTVYLSAGEVRRGFDPQNVVLFDRVRRDVVDGHAEYDNVDPGRAILTVEWKDQSTTLRITIPETAIVRLSDCIAERLTFDEGETVRKAVRESVIAALTEIDDAKRAAISQIGSGGQGLDVNQLVNLTNETAGPNNFAAAIRGMSAKQRRKNGFIIITEDFGARGDGLGDDQPAFMRAITAAVEEGGGTIIVPPGDYAIGAPIAPVNMGTAADGAAETVMITGSVYRGLNGMEPGGARLQAKGAHSIIGGWWNACEISNLCLDMEGHFAPAIDADFSKCLIQHNELINWVGYGMQLCTDKWKQTGKPTYLNKIENNHIHQAGGIGLFASYLMWDSYIYRNNIGSTDGNIMTEGGPHKIHYNWLDGELGPQHNIHMANAGHTTEIIGNYMENCHKESILIQRPHWETGDRRLSFKITGNQIINGGHNSSEDFPAVRVVGNSPNNPNGKLSGLMFNDNQFFDDLQGHWKHAIDLQNIKHASIVGNDWSNNAYTSPHPIKLKGCEDVQVVGNVGGSSILNA